MHRLGVLAATFVLALVPALAWAQTLDRVRLTDKTNIIGEVIAVSPGDVEVKDQREREPRKVSIDQIEYVAFAGEPESLRNARSLLLRQDATGAIEELKKITAEELGGASSNVLAEHAFVTAAAAARQATVTGADVATAEAGLRAFLQKYPRNHNVFRASEILGDLLVRDGKWDAAAAAYAAMEKGPPALAVRAATAKAGSFYAQQKFADAEREYAAAEKTCAEAEQKAEAERREAENNRREKEQAKAIKEANEWKRKEAGALQDRAASARQRHEASTGRARCLTRQGKAADAVKILREVLREADPESRELLGRAYAALGDAYRAAGQEQDALIAFLTVDLVYNMVPESHSEALFNLVELWKKVQSPERSREARQALETSYPESQWTKTLAGADGKG